MASLTAPAYFSHPWFDKPSMKRKHSPSASGESSAGTKRRRVAALERGFSNLSLGQQLSSAADSSSSITISPPYAPPLVSDFALTDASSTAMEIEEPVVVQPDSVEEPLSSPPTPVSREVRMKGTSWYEPEPDRIIVTDLDSSDDEEEESEPPVVSPALLERIREREILNRISIPQLESQALVLYRPLTIPREADTTKTADDDKMQVE